MPAKDLFYKIETALIQDGWLNIRLLHCLVEVSIRQALGLSYGTSFYNFGKISGNNEPGTFDKAKFCPWIPNSLWKARITLIIYASVV